MRVLLVEDDKSLRETIAQVLAKAGYGVDEVDDGQIANTALTTGAYNLVILDLGLPNQDGLEVLRKLRVRKNQTPVLILTARIDVDERVKGLDIGADDYLTKPFALPEFEARVRALIRRGGGGDQILTNGLLSVNCTSHQAAFNDELLDFSAREISILEALMQRPGQVVIKTRLANQLSTWNSEITGNAIEVYIHRLRKKLEPHRIIIKTIHGLGYVLELYRDS